MNEPYITANELSLIVRVTAPTLRAKAARGELPHIKFGRTYRFLASEVTAALRVEITDDWQMSPQSRNARRSA